MYIYPRPKPATRPIAKATTAHVVGEYFPSNSKKETLISFDLFDNGISLLRQAGFQSKYLYHQQEALWNKVFSEYMGEGTMDKLMMENLDKGYITL